jgi:hypothetical protein
MADAVSLESGFKASREILQVAYASKVHSNKCKRSQQHLGRGFASAFECPTSENLQ